MFAKELLAVAVAVLSAGAAVGTETAPPPREVGLSAKKPEAKNASAKPTAAPELRKYSVPPGSAEAVAKTLQAQFPMLRLLALPASDKILVLATPDEHDELAKVMRS